MKTSLTQAFLTLSLIGSLSAPLCAQRITLDKIVARVNGVNILQSALEQARISKEGVRYTLDELILEELLIQRAAEMNMLPTSDEIERQLVSFKIQNNLTDLSEKEFEHQLQQSGFTLATYKQQLGRLIATNKVKSAEISEKIVITSQEVEDYYHKHPEYVEASYLLHMCTLNNEEIENKESLLAENKVSWTELGWIEKKDIGESFSEVFSMQPGQISAPVKEDENIYQIIKLIDKRDHRLKTINERYGDIERLLQQGRREKFLVSLEKELRDKAFIVIL